MLARLVLIILLAIAASIVWRRLRVQLRAPPRPRSIDAKAVQCAHCGVYLARHEAVQRDGRPFCSPEHAARGAREA